MHGHGKSEMLRTREDFYFSRGMPAEAVRGHYRAFVRLIGSWQDKRFLISVGFGRHSAALMKQA